MAVTDTPEDELQDKQNDLLEQLGLHPAQLAIQRRLLGAAQGDSSGLKEDAAQDPTQQPTARRLLGAAEGDSSGLKHGDAENVAQEDHMPLPTGSDGIKPLPRPSGVPGMVEPGNINLTGRPILHNADGTISSERSFSIGTDKGETLLPLIVNGKQLTQQQAIDHYRQTGEHMGIFDTPDHADAYANQVHNRKLLPSGSPVYVYQGDNQSSSMPDTPTTMALGPEADRVNGASARPRSMFSNAEENISHKHHFWGGVLKGLDVAGSIMAPGAMSMFPGTMLNQRVQDARTNNTLSTQAAIRQKNALASQEESKAEALSHPKGTLPRPPKVLFNNAGIPYAIAKGEDEFVIGDPKMPEELKPVADAAVNAHKQRLAEQQTALNSKPDTATQDKQRRRELEAQLKAGSISDEDRADLVSRQQEEKMQGVSAEAQAQAGKPPVPAQYPKGETDAEYKKAATAWGKSVEGIKAREALAPAMARGQAYGAFKPVQVIDPVTGELRWTYAKDAIGSGAAPAGEGTKAMTKKAQFEDMHVAAAKARSAIENLDKPFDATQIAKLTLAMSHDEPSVMHDELKSMLGTKQLTPAQEDFVVWISQLNERAMSLRNVAGMGQGAQDLRSAIRATLPSATSGSKELALKQMDAFQNQMELLEKGIPNVRKKGGGKEPQSTAPHPVNKNPNSDIGFTPSE
jgi:hypothetical protein